jgi:hypothetical protein
MAERLGTAERDEVAAGGSDNLTFMINIGF